MAKKNQERQQPTASGTQGITVKENFLRFVFRRKSNLYLLATVLPLSIAMFIVYKYCIPFPGFCSDSHGYVLAAAKKHDIFYRALGYSRLLSIVHDISHSALFLVTLQYLLLLLASLFLFFTTDYLYGFRHKWIKYTALALMTLNPAYLALANLVLADCTFTAFTVFWFATLLWIQQKAPWWALIVQVVFLYWAFELRYNALFYPAISVLVFLMASKARIPYRVAGIALSLFMVWRVYDREVSITERATNTPVFSGFSGWMMANTALLIYPHISVDATDFDDPEQQLLDRFVKRYIDSVSPDAKKEMKEFKLDWPYLWDKKGPLRVYVTYHILKYKQSYFVSWYQVSPLFYNYGKKIILDHPGAYIQHFILPNTYYFFFPRRYEMRSYQWRSPMEVPKDTEAWFDFKNGKLTAPYAAIQDACSIIQAPLHVLIMVAAIVLPVFFIRRVRKRLREHRKTYTKLFIFWLVFMALYTAFSLLAGPIVLRYQMGLFIICCSLPLWFLDRGIGLGKGEEAS